jgi:hypothetical protein
VWHVISLLALHRFMFLGVVALTPMLIAIFTPISVINGWRFGRKSRIAMSAIVIYMIANMFFGPTIATNVVHVFGATGRATVTDSYATSTVYNNHHVIGYHILIRTADERTIDTKFEDDDFNVYPHHNAVTYPGVGDKFNVRYLSMFPKDFVIISNDDSPWAVGLRCSELRSRLRQANARYGFAPDTSSYRDDYVNAIQAVLNGNCGLNDDEVQSLQKDITDVRASHTQQ